MNVGNWNMGGASDTFMVLSVTLVLLLGIGVYITTTNLTAEARESGCGTLSVLLQLLSPLLTIFLLIGGFYFFDVISTLRGVNGILITCGGGAAIFGLAYGSLLFGNYLYEHPEKLR